MKQRRALVAIATIAAVAAVPTGAVFAKKDHKPPKDKPPKCGQPGQPKCPKGKRGRMTGHGQIRTSEYGKVQWEFRNSVCNSDRFPDLKVEWGDGERFILTAYSVPLTCVDTPADEGNPRAGFDTIVGQGTGTLNGDSGASASFSFTDDGEPGRDDTATITILDADGDVVLELEDVPAGAGGNHQAHRVTGRDARG